MRVGSIQAAAAAARSELFSGLDRAGNFSSDAPVSTTLWR
jgi:hypothetical protein